MKKFQYLFAALALFISRHEAVAADPSAITSVIVYPGGATIERTLKVAERSNRVEISDVPANFDPQSLRIEADPGLQIGEVSLQDTGRSQAVGAREAEIERKIQALIDQKSILDVDAKSAELIRDYLARLGGAPVEGSTKPPSATIDPQSLSAIIEVVARSGRDAFSRLQRVEAQKRELDKQIQALQRDLTKIRSGAKDARSIVVNLTASVGGALRVFYQVHGAGWRPVYRAALDSTASRVELERQAMVSQTTGEDWTGVKIRLSTSQPRLSPQGAEPGPWTIGIQPPPASSVPARNKALGALSAARAAETLSSSAITELQSAFATEFEVPGKIDVPSDGRQVTLSLSRQTMPVKQRVRVAPRMDTAAYVTAEADRPEGVWPIGNVQLYRDGDFVGTTQWDAQSSAQFRFSFGRDDRVRVTVNRVRDRWGDGGFLGNRADREVGYVYTLTNLHKTAMEFLVLESSPVSTADSIEVQTTFEPKPLSTNWESKRGRVAWKETVQPGASLQINAGYIVQYPKQVTVTGLP